MYVDYLSHHGVGYFDNPPGRGSGRYGWGTGENPYQHQYDFLTEVDRLRKKKHTPAQIALILGGVDENGKQRMSTAKLAAEIAIASKNVRKYNRSWATALLDECKGNVSEVARRMGLTREGKPWNESTVRNLLKDDINARQERYEKTADFLRNKIEEVSPRPLDVSSNTELYMDGGLDTIGVSDFTKKVAIEILKKEGYVTTQISVVGTNTNQMTTINVIGRKPKDSETERDVKREMQQNKTNVANVTEFTPNGGVSWDHVEYPAKLDSKRIYIRYADEGGTDKDGVIELRKGVDDISLGKSSYAQVRINVDDKSYLKGMAVYSDDIPKGYDVVVNSNKKSGTAPEKVFKSMKVTVPLDIIAEKYGITKEEVQTRIKKNLMPSPDTVNDLKSMGFSEKEAISYIDKSNPFGALLKKGGQYTYEDENGNEKLSVINKVREEGDWDSWSRTLASQFLAKQPEKLIKQQIDISVSDKRAELDEIKQLTNPVVKKKMLMDYAKMCDSVASDLSVKGFKNQAYQVLLPMNSLQDNEVYAPSYKDGEILALVRYPHGGTFEIPIVKNCITKYEKKLKKIGLDDCNDAILINGTTAKKLSGADYDGDAAICIPLKSNRINVLSTPTPADLLEFDHQTLYKLPDSAPPVTNKTKQGEMGKVTNLITDMTAVGAPMHDIVKATKHSMVVIDAEKHHLDLKQSKIDHDIAALKKKYQGAANAGARTILSKANADVRIDERKETVNRKDMTPEQQAAFDRGEIVYVNTGRTYEVSKPTKADPDRKVTLNKQIKVKGMATVKDAYDLVQNKDNPKEILYADYANSMKAIANEARKEARSIKTDKVNQTAKLTYAKEVASLEQKIYQLNLNDPKERQARSIGMGIAQEKINANPGLDYEHKQRIRAKSLDEARSMVGANREKIYLTDREWEAIQSNAISTTKIEKIMSSIDDKRLKELATPKEKTITNNMENHIKNLYSSGNMSMSEIAKRFGVSTTTISSIINE